MRFLRFTLAAIPAYQLTELFVLCIEADAFLSGAGMVYAGIGVAASLSTVAWTLLGDAP